MSELAPLVLRCFMLLVVFSMGYAFANNNWPGVVLCGMSLAVFLLIP